MKRMNDEAGDVPRVQKRKALGFAAALVMSVTAAFAVAAGVALWRGEWRGAAWLLNGEAAFSWAALSLSVCFGVVFGLVDSLIISFGLESMAPYLPGDEIERAGWSNAVSNGAGALLGAFAASALRLLLRLSPARGAVGDGPVYGSAVGVVAGCVLGIQIARLSRTNGSSGV